MVCTCIRFWGSYGCRASIAGLIGSWELDARRFGLFAAIIASIGFVLLALLASFSFAKVIKGSRRLDLRSLLFSSFLFRCLISDFQGLHALRSWILFYCKITNLSLP